MGHYEKFIKQSITALEMQFEEHAFYETDTLQGKTLYLLFQIRHI